MHCSFHDNFLGYVRMTKVSCDYYLDLLEKTLGAWEDENENQITQVRQDLIDNLVERCGLSEADVTHLR